MRISTIKYHFNLTWTKHGRHGECLFLFSWNFKQFLLWKYKSKLFVSVSVQFFGKKIYILSSSYKNTSFCLDLAKYVAPINISCFLLDQTLKIFYSESTSSNDLFVFLCKCLFIWYIPIIMLHICKLAYFDNWRSQKPLIHIKPNWADMAYYWSFSKLCVTNRPPSKITVVTAINYSLRYIQREKSERKNSEYFQYMEPKL